MSHRVTLLSSLGLASTRAALAFALPALGATFFACGGDFKYAECPDGTEQNGGGHVDEACQRPDGSGGAGGAGGTGGAPPGGGSGGAGGGGGSPQVPPGAECAPMQTRCAEGAQQTCGGDGTWGAEAACDLACDKGGVACVVPVQLAADSKHVCARLSDGTVRCWGSDEAESLGNGDGGNQTKPQAIDGLEGVVELDPTGHCARFEDQTARCWGTNNTFRFDPSSAVTSLKAPSPLVGAAGAVAISVGERHTCLLDGAGAALCKGNSTLGLIGQPGFDPQAEYVPVATTARFASLTSASEATLGSNLGLTKEGSVYCWGIASDCGGAAPDDGLGTPESEYLYKPKAVPSVSSIKALGQGTIPCAVGADGRAQCWGRNDLGQLGRGTSGNALLGAGPVATLDAVVQMASGIAHACAVKEDGTLYCWGANNKGQLGATCGPTLPCQTNTTTNTSFVPNASKVDLAGVVEVRPAGSFTCARTADSKVYCWGDNSKGQLGDGTTGVGRAKPEPVVWK
ncbi:MAG TPA: hypothetical protein VFS43_29145 [Polyangiaceae bacterium]|nr:hypothetical protein [Polyangiaceae bacterium]